MGFRHALNHMKLESYILDRRTRVQAIKVTPENAQQICDDIESRINRGHRRGHVHFNMLLGTLEVYSATAFQIATAFSGPSTPPVWSCFVGDWYVPAIQGVFIRAADAEFRLQVDNHADLDDIRSLISNAADKLEKSPDATTPSVALAAARLKEAAEILLHFSRAENSCPQPEPFMHP